MGLVYQSYTPGVEVKALIDQRLMPALAGVHLELAVAAMHSLIFQQLCPDITEEELVEGVKGVSGWMAAYLSSLDDTTGTSVN